MSVVKQSYPRSVYSNYKVAGLSEEEEYFGISKKLLKEGLLEGNYHKLFDYFFFSYLRNSKDCSKDIKSLVKKFNIEYEDLLLYNQKLCSVALGVINENFSFGMDDNLKFMPELAIDCYRLFLCYVIDVAFGNKKFNYFGINGKLGVLDDPIELLNNKFPSGIKHFNYFLRDVTGKKVGSSSAKELLKSLEFPLFQRYRLKYELLTLGYLIDNLIKEENKSYKEYADYRSYFIACFISEFQTNEYSLELTPELYTLLKKRAYLLPHGGISLEGKNPPLSLDVYERQFNGDNYLVIACASNSSINSIYYTFINLTRQFTVNNNPYLYDICNFLYSFYKLEDSALELYGEDFIKKPNLLFSYKADSILFNKVTVVRGTSDSYKDFTVGVPYSWNNREKSVKKYDSREFHSKGSSGDFTYISAFKRKLPMGQKASDNAKELAKVYCIDLGKDETLVSPFTRGGKGAIK